MKIDDLDSILLYLYLNKEWIEEHRLVTNLSNAGINNDDILKNEILLSKLFKDGYVTKYQEDIPIRVEGEVLDIQHKVSYLISFEGILFLEAAPRLLKNRPYNWQNKMTLLRTSWIVAKTIAIIANAVIIILLTYLTLKKDDKIIATKANAQDILSNYYRNKYIDKAIILDEKHRIILDTVVSRLTEKKEPEAVIRYIVNDFKLKYSSK